MNLSLEEQERLAYIEGRTREADLLSLAIDSEESIAEINRMEEEVQEKEDRITALEGALEEVGDRLRSIKELIDNA